MEDLMRSGKSALTKLLSIAVFGLAGVCGSAKAVAEGSDHDDRSWHEDYLVGKSDMDAVWYHERRRWRS
jgi:hypothetical protein